MTHIYYDMDGVLCNFDQKLQEVSGIDIATLSSYEKAEKDIIKQKLYTSSFFC